MPDPDRPLEVNAHAVPLDHPDNDIYRIIADYTYDWEYLFSSSNQLAYISPSCERVTGYPAQAFYQNPGLLIEIIHPEDKELFRNHVKEHIQHPCTGSIEYRIIHPDGSVRWIGHKCQPAYDSEGKFQGKRISNRDISDQKKVEQQLIILNRDLENRVDERTNQLRTEINSRKQVERELKNRLRIEHTLAKISANFIEFQDFDLAVNTTLRSIGQLAQAKRVGLYCSREYGAYFECTHEWCCPRTVSQTSQNRHVSGGIFARWIEDYQDVKALHVDDMNKLPPGYLPGINRLTGEPAHALLLLPINIQSDLLGFLSLEDIPPSSYWQKEGLSLLGIVAQMIGNGLERERMLAALEERVRERTNELKIIYEVASLASKPLPVEEVLRKSLEKLLEIRKRQVGFIQLLIEDRGSLRLLTSRDIPAAIVALAENRAWQQLLLDRFIHPNALMVIPDLTQELGTTNKEILGGYNAMLGVPVRDKDRARGVIVVLGEHFIPISPEQMTLISAITDQIQVAVESAGLRQQAEETAIIEERQRLARDLHDSVTQSLYSMGLLARGWQRGVDSASREEIKQRFTRLGDLATHAMKEMRLLLYDLRPLTLQQDGLEGALHRRLEAVEGKLNVKTELRVDRYLRLDSRMEQELYHIAQESLNNILKYSEASKVSVSLKAQNGCVELEISDNGIGFELPAIEHTHGIGLASMRERTEKMGGSFHISSMPGQGTCVRVRVPADDHVPLLLHVDT